METHETSPIRLAEFSQPCVEGEELRIEGQQLKFAGRPRPLAGFSEIVYPITADTSARAVLTKAYKIHGRKIATSSMLTVDSEIHGRKVVAYGVDVGCLGVGGKARSGKHKRQFHELSGNVFAVVVTNSFGGSLPQHPNEILAIPSEPRAP